MNDNPRTMIDDDKKLMILEDSESINKDNQRV